MSTRIRIARRAVGLSQAQLAKMLGITRGAVANWESATEAFPAVAHLESLAIATGVNFEWLATGRGERCHRIETPAADAMLVYEPDEMRLIVCFRHANAALRRVLLAMIESQPMPARATHRA